LFGCLTQQPCGCCCWSCCVVEMYGKADVCLLSRQVPPAGRQVNRRRSMHDLVGVAVMGCLTQQPCGCCCWSCCVVDMRGQADVRLLCWQVPPARGAGGKRNVATACTSTIERTAVTTAGLGAAISSSNGQAGSKTCFELSNTHSTQCVCCVLQLQPDFPSRLALPGISHLERIALSPSKQHQQCCTATAPRCQRCA
jgi:hypothetical protein